MTNTALANGFAEVGYHSCGASSHLLEGFAQIPRVTAIELGPGTDLAAAAELFPQTAMRPLVDPLLMRNSSVADVGEAVTAALDATRAAPSTTLCAWSLDRDTPFTNVETLYETVRDWH